MLRRQEGKSASNRRRFMRTMAYGVCFACILLVLAIVLNLFYQYLTTQHYRELQTHVMQKLIIGFVVMVVLVAFLISYVIYMIASLHHNQDVLNHQKEANKQLSRALEEARAANAAKSIFLSHISHDIRTPINGIIGMTDIALRNISDVEQILVCLRNISASSKHLTSLVNDVLDMSQIEQGEMTMNQKSMDLSVLLRNCSSIIYGQLIQRKINYVENFDAIEHERVIGDELHLRQVLVNILGNAIKFTTDGGTIEFRVKELEEEDQIVKFQFEIQDDGIGMSDEYQKHIFEPFSQENGDNQGTGLGMSITKKLVELMDGTIEVESTLEQGSLFRIELAMMIDQVQPEEAMTEESRNLEAMKVLVVEDNFMNMEIIKCILKEEKVEVVPAVNGKEGVECFRQSALHEFDVILMDIMMPVMDGITAVRYIRNMQRADAKVVPIIAMTANAYTEDVKKVLDAGMNLHVAKPVDVAQLIKILSKYKK